MTFIVFCILIIYLAFRFCWEHWSSSSDHRRCNDCCHPSALWTLSVSVRRPYQIAMRAAFGLQAANHCFKACNICNLLNQKRDNSPFHNCATELLLLVIS